MFSKFIIASALIATGLVMAIAPSSAQEKPRVGESEGRAEQPRERAVLGGAYRNRVVFQRGKGDPKDESKLFDGDKIVSINGVAVNSNPEMVAEYEKNFAGDKVKIGVERNIGTKDKPETKSFILEVTANGLSRYYEKTSIGAVPLLQFHPRFKSDFPDSGEYPEAIARTMLKKNDREGEVDKLIDVFKKHVSPARGFYRNAYVFRGLEEPFRNEGIARGIAKKAMAPMGEEAYVSGGFFEMLRDDAGVEHPISNGSTGFETLVETPSVQRFSTEDLEYFIKCPIQAMARVDSTMESAFSTLSEEDHTKAMSFARRFAPFSGIGAGNVKFDAAWQSLKGLPRKSLARFFDSTKVLYDSQCDWSDEFRAAFVKHAATKDGIGKAQTTTIGEGDDAITYRWIVGGPGDDKYTDAYDLIIDLGGNDTYDLTARGNENIRRSQIIIDISGNDKYTSRKGGIAAGIFGASYLIDMEGDDSYESNDRGQGFGLFGVGALIDHKGNDSYKMSIYGQGLGCVGLGLLYDGDGNDRYDAGSFAQGCGFPGGYGALVDKKGDDVFLCTGKFPSPYGDKGEFQGFGQGCGIGFRGLAMGGIGVIADGGGKDIYRVGQFGLGIGYYFGMGIVYEAGGDDSYECSRYGLGTGAHYGVGVVLDEKGNDLYRATRRSAVAEMGSVWDLSVGVLVDSEGNDTYLAKSYAIGGASQNAIGIFWDKKGNDLYSANGKDGALGYIGDASYGGGRGAENLSIFLDSEGDDTYTMEGRGNGKQGINKKFGVWADLPIKKE